MREVRDAMDRVAEEQGRDKRIEVSAIVVSTEQENLYNAMDLKAWVDQGLVDTLIPYGSEPNVGGNERSWTDVRDLDYFIGITKGTPCRLAPNIMPRHTTAEDYRRRALALYEAGIEDLFFWDCDILQARLEDMVPWQTLCRLGHREEIEGVALRGRAPDRRRGNAIHQAGRLGPVLRDSRLGNCSDSVRSEGSPEGFSPLAGVWGLSPQFPKGGRVGIKDICPIGTMLVEMTPASLNSYPARRGCRRHVVLVESAGRWGVSASQESLVEA